MKEQIKQILRLFCIISTGTIFGAGICISITDPYEVLHVNIVWQILLLSFLMACLTPIFYSKKELGRKEYLLRTFIHYLGVSTILIIGGMKFRWIGIHGSISIYSFVIIITMVYIAITGGICWYDQKTSTRLNHALEDYHRKLKNNHEE